MIYSKNNLNSIPEFSGIYIFRSQINQVIYIGKAINLRKRIKSYFFNKKNLDPKTASLVKQIDKIEITVVQSEFETLLLEAELIRLNLPKYNIIWKDDKHYIYIRITKEDFPRILVSRRREDEQSIFFGPFPSSGIVRNMLSYIRSVFPFCTQNPKNKNVCFYTHIGLCHPCPAEIKKMSREIYKKNRREYLKNIINIKWLLQGKTKKVQHHLYGTIRRLAKELKFEEALVLRERLKNLDYLVNKYYPSEAYMINPCFTENIWRKEQKSLSDLLIKYYPGLDNISRIECYDVSNISGKLATGAMVTFIDGQPAKNYYRRFLIKSVKSANDYAMLKEVLTRRLQHKQWPLPNLFIIDGGKPQLATLIEALSEHDISLPCIGLAKQVEEIVTREKGKFIKFKLPKDSPALHLIQRLRDEAHRFAHKYHELLRLKYLTA